MEAVSSGRTNLGNFCSKAARSAPILNSCSHCRHRCSGGLGERRRWTRSAQAGEHVERRNRGMHGCMRRRQPRQAASVSPAACRSDSSVHSIGVTLSPHAAFRTLEASMSLLRRALDIVRRIEGHPPVPD
jgi:hypothetical protein